jgi:hypothetical protein
MLKLLEALFNRYPIPYLKSSKVTLPTTERTKGISENDNYGFVAFELNFFNEFSQKYFSYCTGFWSLQFTIPLIFAPLLSIPHFHPCQYSVANGEILLFLLNEIPKGDGKSDFLCYNFALANQIKWNKARPPFPL